MKIIIHGANGRIGKEVNKLVMEGYKNSSLAAAVDRQYTTDPEAHLYNKLDDFDGEADCIIDFSNHSLTKGLTDYARRRKIPLIVATTGQTQEEFEIIHETAKEIPVFLAANMSLGVAVLLKLVKIATEMMSDSEIGVVEKHHDKKYDAPSGTALLIANEIKNARKQEEEVEIHSIRLGNLVGEHEVIIGTGSETLNIKHKAHSKVLFAEGAMSAAEFLIDKPAGLYGMKDLVG